MAYAQDFWKDQWSNIIFFVIIMLNLIAIFSILGLNFKDDTNKDYKKIIDDLQRYWDANQKLWEEESAECQTVYQYLKENIHVDDK